MIRPFEVTVAPEVIADLHSRLGMARIAPDLGNDDWSYGTNSAYLAELVRYWREDYDWEAQRRQINRFPQFMTEIDGQPIHFVHVRGKGEKIVPIILNHGWPWTFHDMSRIVGPLSDPAAHGASADVAFDVVVPSLPGYGFSPLTKTGINFWKTADMWVELMAQLGYDRFATYGSDWGALVSSQLGHKYADRLIGVHLTLAMPLTTFGAPLPGPEYYGEGEEGWFERTAHFFAAESGYSAIQATQPQSLAHGLNDSPVGQLSWLLEKRRSWSDCKGNVESVFSKDDLINTAMIYWITQTGGSSGRYYYECVQQPWSPSHDNRPVVPAPTCLSVFANDITLFPRRWSEEYYNLKSWRAYPEGGHFAPWEHPETIVQDVRDGLRGSA